MSFFPFHFLFIFFFLWDEKLKDLKLTVYESHEAIEGRRGGYTFVRGSAWEGDTDLDAVVTGGDLAVLHFHVGRGMGELALGVLARTFVALKLPTDLQLQPA